MKFRYILTESKEDIAAFINKFTKEAYDTFNKYKSSISKRLKDKDGKPVSNDITWHVKHTTTEEMQSYINKLLNRDIEGKPIPEPVNTKELILDKNGEKLYKVYDYEDMIELSEGTGDGRMQNKFGDLETGWCIGGRYDIPFGQVKVSQAKEYFPQYMNDYSIDYYYVLIRKDGLKFCVMGTEDEVIITDHDDNETTNIAVLQNYFPECAKKLLNVVDTFTYTGQEVVPDHILNLVVADNVTEINEATFANCDLLKTVDMPNVTKIGKKAFRNCKSLETINMPNVVEIGDSAFQYCRSLKTVNMMNVTEIARNAFGDCSSLEAINIPNVTSIGKFAFCYCPSLKMVNMPSVITIYRSAFDGCTTLTTINIPNVTEIDACAFQGCTSLETVTAPNATKIYSYAFRNCILLKTVDIPKVTDIGGAAFWECKSLETINAPNAINIYNYVFYKCPALKTIDLPNVVEIGDGAFEKCSSIEIVNMPKAIKINKEAFVDCASLKTVRIPNATDIGRNAFWIFHRPNFTIHCSKENIYVQNYCKENNIPVVVID